MKTCSACKAEKLLIEFYKCVRRTDGYQSSCKVCMNACNTGSRKKNPSLYRKLSKGNADKYHAEFIAWKEQQKCLLCSEDTTRYLDLHHLDPTQKDASISDISRGQSWSTLKKEIDKCIVVCRNCHAKIHADLISLLKQMPP